MSSMICSPSDVTVSKIEFGPVKLLDSGGKTANVNYETRPIRMETPSLNVPYGINVFDKNGPPKYSVDLSLRGAEENADVGAFQSFLEAFDERMIDAGVENAGKWFKMPMPASREVIKAFYTPLLKFSKDPQGKPKPYPPTVKLALRKKKDTAATATSSNSFEVEFYNAAEKDSKGQPTKFAPDLAVDQVLVKRSQVTAIIQCTGIWFAGGKFGTTWKAVQLRVDSQPEQIRGPAFRSEAPDIRAFAKAKAVAGSGSGSGSGSGYAGEDEDDGEEDAAEEVVAPVVAKKVVAAAPVVAPAPAPAFEDEEVAEPVPVPTKKVVKKVVTKAAPKA